MNTSSINKKIWAKPTVVIIANGYIENKNNPAYHEHTMVPYAPGQVITTNPAHPAPHQVIAIVNKTIFLC